MTKNLHRTIWHEALVGALTTVLLIEFHRHFPSVNLVLVFAVCVAFSILSTYVCTFLFGYRLDELHE